MQKNVLEQLVKDKALRRGGYKQQKIEQEEEEEYDEDNFVVEDDDEQPKDRKHRKQKIKHVQHSDEEDEEEKIVMKNNQKDMSHYMTKIEQKKPHVPSKKVAVIEDDIDLNDLVNEVYQQQAHEVPKPQMQAGIQNRYELEKPKYQFDLPQGDKKKRTQEDIEREDQGRKEAQVEQLPTKAEVQQTPIVTKKQEVVTHKPLIQMTQKSYTQQIPQQPIQIQQVTQQNPNIHHQQYNVPQQREPIHISFKQTAESVKEIQEQDQSINFYWIDINEDITEPGQIYLFGKVMNYKTKQYESCSVVIKDFWRTVYLLPHQPTDNSEEEMLIECQRIMKKHAGLERNDWEAQMVFKKYDFELAGVPTESQYLEVRYSYRHRNPLPMKLSSRMFKLVLQGTQTATEQFIIFKHVMGPCWLQLQSFQLPDKPALSTRHVLMVADAKKVVVHPMSGRLASPPLKVLSIAVKGIIEKLKAEKYEEVLMISMVLMERVDQDGATDTGASKDFYKTLIRMPTGRRWPTDYRSPPNVVQFDCEREVLGAFVQEVNQLDPDIIVGHNLNTNILDLVAKRMQKFKLDTAYLLGRVKRQNASAKNNNLNIRIRGITVGRLLVCTFVAGKELVKGGDMSLKFLSKKFLGDKELVFVESDVSEEYMESGQLIIDLANYTMNEAVTTIDVCHKLQVIPLTKSLTCICGNTWIRSLQNQRAERIEMLLMHEFKQSGYILPDKKVSKYRDEVPNEDDEKGDKKKKFAGGMVLEPVPDIYTEYIILLDFNSLYPSIIMEYNICFTTVVGRQKETVEQFLQQNIVRKGKKEEKMQNEEENQDQNGDDREEINDGGCKVDSTKKKLGILPGIIRRLLNNRKQAKQKMKESQGVERQVWDIRQLAIKLVANSMYGCLGFKGSRFYAVDIASMITQNGRNILTNSLKMVGNMGYDVVYGDTDSMMVNPHKKLMSEVIMTGNEIITAINKEYKLLQLGLDGIFITLLLLTKKKYAALKVANLDDILQKKAQVKTEMETKGIDIVRKGFCDFSKQIQQMVLDILLSTQERDTIIQNLLELMGEIKEYFLYLINDGQDAEKEGEMLSNNKFIKNRVNIGDLVISVQLNKAIKDYGDINRHPQVCIAKQMIEAGASQDSLIGHNIPYIICEDAGQKLLALRAYRPEVVAKKSLRIDYNYYRSSQVFDPISRLCKPIKGLELSQLAEAIGVESYKNKTQNKDKIEYFAEKKIKINVEQEYLKAFETQCSCTKAITWNEFIVPLDKVDAKSKSNKVEYDLKCPHVLKYNNNFCIQCLVVLDKTLCLKMKYQITLKMKALIKHYYRGEAVCKNNKGFTNLCISYNQKCFGNCCNPSSDVKYHFLENNINFHINVLQSHLFNKTLEQLFNAVIQSLYQAKEKNLIDQAKMKLKKPFREINLLELFQKFKIC